MDEDVSFFGEKSMDDLVKSYFGRTSIVKGVVIESGNFYVNVVRDLVEICKKCGVEVVSDDYSESFIESTVRKIKSMLCDAKKETNKKENFNECKTSQNENDFKKDEMNKNGLIEDKIKSINDAGKSFLISYEEGSKRMRINDDNCKVSNLQRIEMSQLQKPKFFDDDSATNDNLMYNLDERKYTSVGKLRMPYDKINNNGNSIAHKTQTINDNYFVKGNNKYTLEQKLDVYFDGDNEKILDDNEKRIIDIYYASFRKRIENQNNIEGLEKEECQNNPYEQKEIFKDCDVKKIKVENKNVSATLSEKENIENLADLLCEDKNSKRQLERMLTIESSLREEIMTLQNELTASNKLYEIVKTERDEYRKQPKINEDPAWKEGIQKIKAANNYIEKAYMEEKKEFEKSIQSLKNERKRLENRIEDLEDIVDGLAQKIHKMKEKKIDLDLESELK